MIFYTMTIYALDSWSYGYGVSDNDHYGIAFDSKTIVGSRFCVYTFFENLCGSSSMADLRNIRVFGRVTHSALTLTLKIIDLLDEESQNESVAVRDIDLLFVTTSGVTEYMCQLAPLPVPDNVCSCAEGKYLDASSVCQPCHANCASCFGPAATQCYQCKVGNSLISNACTTCAEGCASCHDTTDTGCDACVTGYLLFNSKSCIYPCLAPLVAGTGGLGGCTNICSSPCPLTDYVYWDSTCEITCPLPYKSDFMNSYVKECRFPCATATDFVYWDGTCSSTCATHHSPGLYKGKKTCSYPCLTGKYLMWDGTCVDTCLWPLTVVHSQGKMYCNYPCATGESLYWNGLCITGCNPPLTPRSLGLQLFCDFGCQANEYLYWDGSCNKLCSRALTPVVEGTIKPRSYCKYLGLNTDFLYWDGSYSSSCNPPLVSSIYKMRNFCSYPCTGSDYLYWNGSCISSCLYPLSPRTELGHIYCDFNCPSTSYLTWTGTCTSTCPSPLQQRVEGISMIRKFCTSPCSSLSKFVYWDSSCTDTCDPPLTTTTFNGQKICQFPCSDTRSILLYDGSCIDNCRSPYIFKAVAHRAICLFPCLTSEFLFADGSCIPSCPYPMTFKTGLFGDHTCSGPCNQILLHYNPDTKMCSQTCDKGYSGFKDLYLQCTRHSLVTKDPDNGLVEIILDTSEHKEQPSFIALTQLTQYVRFLNIQMPKRLRRLTQSPERQIWFWRLGHTIPENLKAHFTKHILPVVFENPEGIHSSFFVNFWDEILLLTSILVIGILFKGIEKLAQRTSMPTLLAASRKMRVLLIFNVGLMLMTISIGDIILYAYIDYTTFKTIQTPEIINIVCSVMMMVISAAIFVVNVVVISKFQKLRRSGNFDGVAQRNFHKTWEGASVLYRGLREDSYSRQLFHAIYTMRLAFSMMFAIALVDFPMTASILQLCMNLGILGFIMLAKPIKKRINHNQLVLAEAGACSVSLFSFILSVLAQNNVSANSYASIILGDLIIAGNIYMNVVIIVYVVLKTIDEFKAIRAHQKSQTKADTSQWFRLLVPLLQQGAFGFEEVFDDSINDVAYIPEPIKKRVFPFSLSKVFPQRKGIELNRSPIPTYDDVSTRRVNSSTLRGDSDTLRGDMSPLGIKASHALVHEEESMVKSPDRGINTRLINRARLTRKVKSVGLKANNEEGVTVINDLESVGTFRKPLETDKNRLMFPVETETKLEDENLPSIEILSSKRVPLNKLQKGKTQTTVGEGTLQELDILEEEVLTKSRDLAKRE